MVGFQGGLTALHLAVREGQTQAVQALLEAKADINQQTPADKTSPLLLATINGHYDLAKLLLERGADPNLASDAGASGSLRPKPPRSSSARIRPSPARSSITATSRTAWSAAAAIPIISR